MSPRPSFIGLGLAALALAGATAGAAARAVLPNRTEGTPATPPPLPLAFEPNRGQAPKDIRYMARIGGGRLLVRTGSLALRLRGEEFGLNLVGASQSAPIAERRAPGVVNYLQGRDPSKWRTNVPLYETIRMPEVYPGIDLVVHGRSGKLEYDFEVAPGADPSTVAFRLCGGDPELDANGDLVVKSSTSEVRHQKPVVYQTRNGRRELVPGAFRLASAGKVSFELGEYDRTLPLVIDPVLLVSTYFGGSGDDTVQDVVTDHAGGVFLVGTTFSDDFPVHGGGDRNLNGSTDAFVARFRNRGGALDYCTFLGGSDDESGLGIDLGLDGEVCVAGLTRSNNFPTRSAAFPDFRGGFDDAFIARLNAAGDNLIFATYFGGGDGDIATGVTVGPEQDVFITGRTASQNLPGTNGGAQEELAGIQDAFVARLDHDGQRFEYVTYLGGGDVENVAASGGHIAVDRDGNAYVTGTTFSADFPTTRDAFQREGGDDNDVFITRVNPEGRRFDYSTYLGGSLNDFGTGIVVDRDGSAIVTGATSSLDFPTTGGAVQRQFGGGDFDAFLTRLAPGGNRLDFSTFLGGTRSDASIDSLVDGAGDVALDVGGNIYVTGSTESEDFPKRAAAQRRPGGNFDSFLTVFSETGDQLLSSTLLGGANSDQGNCVAVDNQLGAWVGGQTQSNDFPVRRAFQAENPGGFLDGTLSRIGLNFPRGRHLFVSPKKLEFGSVNVNRSRIRTLLIQNRGKNPLTVEVSPLDEGPFEIVSGLGETTLGAGEAVGITIRFSPTDEGTARRTLHVLSNDRENREVKVRVNGIGR